ncbi:MAG: hypothetical protein JSS14_22565 [Proteobacteria bacterium]|nr:hypothetical protein [Pseudomonadota bacterium]
MSSFDSDKCPEGAPLEDALWTGDGDGDSVVHPQVNPGFNNAEADDVLHDSFEGPTDVDPREPGETQAPKKKSNMGFYAAVGGFVIAAVGLVGYKSGLLTSSSKKPIEPNSMAAMPDEAPKKTDSLMVAAAPGGAASGDVLGSAGAQAAGSKKPSSSFEAEADLLAERPAAPATPAPAALAPTPAATHEPAAPVAAPAMPVATAAPAAAPGPAAPGPAAPAPAPAAPTKVAEAPAAPVVAEKPVVGDAPAVEPEPKAAEPKAAAAPEAAPRKAVKTATSQPTTTGVATKQTKASKPLVVAKASKPAKPKRIEKDATPDGKEVLAGWKLRGTWPSQGPHQLAWVTDEQGRLMTVTVGQRISGARVLSIGKRGEVVQTSAGQILP